MTTQLSSPTPCATTTTTDPLHTTNTTTNTQQIAIPLLISNTATDGTPRATTAWLPFSDDISDGMNDGRAWCIAGDFAALVRESDGKTKSNDQRVKAHRHENAAEEVNQEGAAGGEENEQIGVAAVSDSAQLLLSVVCGAVDAIAAAHAPAAFNASGAASSASASFKVTFATQSAFSTFKGCAAVHGRPFLLCSFDCPDDASYCCFEPFYRLVKYCSLSVLKTRGGGGRGDGSLSDDGIAAAKEASIAIPDAIALPIADFFKKVLAGTWPKARQGQAPADNNNSSTGGAGDTSSPNNNNNCPLLLLRPCHKLGLTTALKSVECTYIPLVYEPLIDVVTVVYSTRCPCCPEVIWMVDRIVSIINRHRTRAAGEPRHDPMWSDVHCGGGAVVAGGGVGGGGLLAGVGGVEGEEVLPGAAHSATATNHNTNTSTTDSTNHRAATERSAGPSLDEYSFGEEEDDNASNSIVPPLSSIAAEYHPLAGVGASSGSNNNNNSGTGSDNANTTTNGTVGAAFNPSVDIVLKGPSCPTDMPCYSTTGLVSTRLRLVLCNIDENDLGPVDWPTRLEDQIVPHIRCCPATDLRPRVEVGEVVVAGSKNEETRTTTTAAVNSNGGDGLTDSPIGGAATQTTSFCPKRPLSSFMCPYSAKQKQLLAYQKAEGVETTASKPPLLPPPAPSPSAREREASYMLDSAAVRTPRREDPSSLSGSRNAPAAPSMNASLPSSSTSCSALPMGSRDFFALLQEKDAEDFAKGDADDGDAVVTTAASHSDTSPSSHSHSVSAPSPRQPSSLASYFTASKNGGTPFNLHCNDRTAVNVAKFFLEHLKRTQLSKEAMGRVLAECAMVDEHVLVEAARKKRARSDGSMNMLLSRSGNMLEM